MVVTISLVVFFGFILALLLRFKSLNIGAAFVAVMFGFFLASTGAGGPITRLTAAVLSTLSDLTR